MTNNKLSVLACIAVLFFSACGEKPNEKNNESEISGSEMNHEEMMENGSNTELLEIPADAKVYFGNLEDGQTVTSPVHIEFEVNGMEVEKAGELNENKGHHHLIVDGKALERGEMVPANATNIHYGQGQKEVDLELPKGEHTLTLQFADGYHQSYGEQMSSTISLTVE